MTSHKTLNPILLEISEAFKKVNALIQGTFNRPLHLVNFLETVRLYSKKTITVGSTFPTIFIAKYDVILSLILEAGIIRGIRYSGQKPLEKYFYMVEKLEIGSERIYQFPTLITRGQIKEKELQETRVGFIEALDKLVFLLHQPKPLILRAPLKDIEKRYTSIFPSPFTGAEIIYSDCRKIVAPFYALAQISFQKSRSTSCRLFCYPAFVNCVEAGVRLYAYKPLEGRVELTNTMPALIPRLIIRSYPILQKAFQSSSMVTTGAILAVDSKQGFVLSYNTRKLGLKNTGRLVVIATLPYFLEYSLFSQPAEIEETTPNKLKGINLTPDKRKIPIRQKIPVRLLHTVARQVERYQGRLRRQLSSVIASKTSLIQRHSDMLETLATPLIAISINTPINTSELEEPTQTIALPSKTKTAILKNIQAIQAWTVAINSTKIITSKYGLYIPI